jgi:hypothetical protein
MSGFTVVVAGNIRYVFDGPLTLEIQVYRGGFDPDWPAYTIESCRFIFADGGYDMLYGVKQLHGYKLRETNGDIGDVREVYFDDHVWRARYFVVETGRWLFGRQVLISPVAVTNIDAASRTLSVNLTREQVKNSPDIDTDEPISRQNEARLSQYYGWLEYWESSSALTSGMVYPFGVLPITPLNELMPAAASSERGEGAPEDQHIQESHLRSTNAVTGYRVAATDGDLGYVGDFVIDDKDWSIRYLVLDTGAWAPGRKILLATGWIENISWDTSRVTVNLPKAVIETCPAYDPSQPITREYETRLFEHCRRHGYWEATPPQQTAAA